MEFVIYSHWEELPNTADTLFCEAERDSLFVSQIWLKTLTTHGLDDDQSLFLACVTEDEEMLAILPLIKSSQGGLKSLSNNFTTLYSILISSLKPSHLILDCLAKGLSQLPIQAIRLEPIDSKDAVMKQLQKRLQENGLQSQTFFRFYNWTHPVNNQSFKEYMKDRPAQLRNTIKRKQSKLSREHESKIILYKNSNINQAIHDYKMVYQASWKANEYFSDFTPALVQNLAHLGCLRLGILYINQQAVAAQIWFIVHGKANIYRLVYDENWKQYSPGSILTNYLIQHVLDVDKVSEIDFLTGNENYKQDWMSVRKERIGMVFAKQKKQTNLLNRTSAWLAKRIVR